MCIKQNITNEVVRGNASKVKSLVEVALQMGLSQKEILTSMLTGIEIIGNKFKENRLYIPDVMMSSRAMHAGLFVLELISSKVSFKSRKKMVIGTVAGDLHDIGKKLIILTLQGVSMEVIDLGVDVPPEKFVEAVRVYKPDVLGMSALLSITKPMLEETVCALEKNNLRKNLKIIIGGGPVSSDYAYEIGADGCANDPFETIELIERLFKQPNSCQ